ncbi:hypothetical protein ATANTOWER_032003 [Ataeniobius toweri]|uniref:Uncharacterized protein n=1 Tax=Ataeniobius toweri TaxID=208326 RepID=A0ABU7C7J1_9TELE|nr:hypothetical protein [Ataeniobius toweri]
MSNFRERHLSYSPLGLKHLSDKTKTNHLVKYFECLFCKGMANFIQCFHPADVSVLYCAAVLLLKRSYKGQLIWVGFRGGRDMKVSQVPPEPINLSLNEVAHL